MKKRSTKKQFVICIDNSDYPASLEMHKAYAVLPDEKAAEDNFIRVVDESGEDYLYSAKRFVPVDLPQRVKQSIRRIRETTMLAKTALKSTSGANSSKSKRVGKTRRSRLSA